MRVEVTGSAPPDWDAFASAHPDGSAYHLAPAVRIGSEAFGLESLFLTARGSDGELRGLLPLVQQSSRLFGRYLTSLPFFNYGGVLADGPDSLAALVAEAAVLGAQRGARHVELRHVAALGVPGVAERLDKVTMILPLPADEAQLAKRLGAKLRSQIRRAEREAPEVVWGGAELLPAFHAVFARGMRDLGTPVYPPRFFAAYWAALGHLSRVLVLRVRGEVQAVALVVRHGDRLEVPWAVALPEAKRGALNMRLYWEMLRFAIGSGATAFDFGRSTVDSGTYRFKAQWGAEPRQLHWHYWLPPGAAVPALNQSNPKFALAAALWRRLPLWCANALGPRLIRHLP